MLLERRSNLGCESSMVPATAGRIKVVAAAAAYNGLVKWVVDLMSLVYETHLRDIGARRVCLERVALQGWDLGGPRTLELNKGLDQWVWS